MTSEHKLGRVDPPDDPRDAAYPMALHLDLLPPKVYLSRYWYPSKSVLNQGNVGACIGFTGANWIQNSPVRSAVTNQTGFGLYAACKAIDGFPSVEGTFDRALMQVLITQGRIDRYLWAQTPSELLDWVLTTGPVMVGTNWYGSMFDPNAEGFINISGSVAGGHEYLIRGYSNPRKAYRVRNSWGGSWGMNGEAWIAKADLERLVFAENGDACAATERFVK